MSAGHGDSVADGDGFVAVFSPVFPSSLRSRPSCPLPFRSRVPLNQSGGLGERCKLTQRGPLPKTNSVHSRAVRKSLVAVVLSVLKCMFYSRSTVTASVRRPRGVGRGESGAGSPPLNPALNCVVWNGMVCIGVLVATGVTQRDPGAHVIRRYNY